MAQIKAKVSLAGSRGAWTAKTKHVALGTVLDTGIHPRGYLGEKPLKTKLDLTTLVPKPEGKFGNIQSHYHLDDQRKDRLCSSCL